MGGDQAPVNETAGAVSTINEYPNLKIILAGDKDRIEKELKKFKFDRERLTIHHCSEVIDMHDSPSEAIKKKPTHR